MPGRDPVDFWLGRVASATRHGYWYGLRRFVRYLGANGYPGLDAAGLLRLQREAGDQYVVLDLLQRYVGEVDLARGSKALIYAAVQSFFNHNRCALPRDSSFRIRGSRHSVVPRLTVENIVDVVKAANLRDRSIVLFKWMSLQDNARFAQICRTAGEQVVEQLESKENPIRIDVVGRKSNVRRYYTFIGSDAATALRAYFDEERGWPKPGEPIWLGKHGRPVGDDALKQMWMALLRRTGLVKKKRSAVGTRYGYNLHEMRDVAKSLLHVKAKADGFDMDCCEYWLGHTVDPLGYDKFFRDHEYVRKQYLIAEPYLNIISSPPEREETRRSLEQMKNMQEEIAELRTALATVQSRIGSPR